MNIVRTVCGDIAPEEMGLTYAHEHLLTDPPVSVTDADLTMDSEEAAIRELGSFRAAGGRTLVEMTPPDYGRNPEGLRRVSEASGVHVICTTGWLKDSFCRPFVADRSVEDLANEMIRDIEHGIGDTGVRAGLIKAASSLNTITPAEEKVFRAAARAQRATGAVITTHTEAGTMALEQVTLLRSEDVDPSRIVIGHLDRKLDLAYQCELLATGVTINYDQIGKEKYYPDSLRVEMLLELVKLGFGKQIMLSMDHARKSYWPSYGNWGGPGLSYILWRFAPWLHEHGLSAEVINDMLVYTPARMFQIAKPTLPPKPCGSEAGGVI